MIFYLFRYRLKSYGSFALQLSAWLYGNTYSDWSTKTHTQSVHTLWSIYGPSSTPKMRKILLRGPVLKDSYSEALLRQFQIFCFNSAHNPMNIPQHNPNSDLRLNFIEISTTTFFFIVVRAHWIFVSVSITNNAIRRRIGLNVHSLPNLEVRIWPTPRPQRDYYHANMLTHSR